MATDLEALRGEIRFAAELHDTARKLIDVALRRVRVRAELLGGAAGVLSGRHEVMAAVARQADDLGGERGIQAGEQSLVFHARSLVPERSLVRAVAHR